MGKVMTINLNGMRLDEYQEKAKETCKKESYNLFYLTLGLVGEAGEVAEKIKKTIRDNAGVITKEKELEIILELGDVLWYIAILADFLGYSLDDVAKKNIKKLKSRQKRGRISGSGDFR